LKFEGYPHVLKSQQFSRKWVEKVLFPLSDKISNLLKKKNRDKLRNLLKNKTMVSLFASESSRTRASHEIGFNLMGGKVAFTSASANISSAMGKGESFEDTVKLFDQYHCDLIVARNDSAEQMPIDSIARGIRTPIINAGDGAGKDKQHPTQALLDIYTIYKHLGKMDNLRIAVIGDLKNGRTVRSLCYLLAKWRIKHIYLVSPLKLKVSADIKSYLRRHNIKFSEHCDIRKIAPKVNVFYQTRTQTNLGSPKMSRSKTNKSKEFTIINKEVLNLCSKSKNSIIMHPLPCLEEITRNEVDKDPRSVYFESKTSVPSQLKCGLITRMAIMLLMLNPKKAKAILKS
jgi:aspartate carbamoyltransferase catalytic subunit